MGGEGVRVLMLWGALIASVSVAEMSRHVDDIEAGSLVVYLLARDNIV